MTTESKNQPEKTGIKQWWPKAKEALHVVAGTPRILKLIWQTNKAYALAAIVLNALLALVPLAQFQLTKLILDALTSSTASHETQVSRVLLLVIIFAGLSLLSNCLEPTSSLIEDTLGDHLTRNVNMQILRKTSSFPDITMFENPKYYNTLEKIEEGASYKPLQAFRTVKTLVRSVIGLLSMLVVLFAFQPLLTIALVVFSLPHLIVEFMHRREEWSIQDYRIPEVRKMHYFRSMATRDDCAKEVRIFGLGTFFLDRYLASFESFFNRHQSLRKRHWRNNLLLAALSAVGTAGAYAWVAITAIEGKITVGSLSMYFGVIGQVVNELSLLVWSTSSIYESNLYMNEFFQFLSFPDSMKVLPAETAQPVPEPLSKGIEFRNVEFKYPSKEKLVLNDISFTVRAGSTVALVGENGAGKTTIVKLLSRLYDPTSGAILIDGVDMRECNLDQWRANIGVIFQDFSHYHMKARDNIAIGQISAFDDLDAIKQAAERGGASAMVAELPDTYDTMLGYWFHSDKEGSSELSGGQWQKIGLARAFMRSLRAKEHNNGSKNGYIDAQILILDEPTAALDAKAEYDVYSRFKELTEGKTTIFISHRFSSVRMADQIILIDGGKVKEQGSHDELMALDGEYAKLYNLQADRYK